MTHGPAFTPMSCAGFEATLTDRVDGVLSEAARASGDAHIATCAACRSLEGDLAELRADAGRLPVLKPSRDLWSDISARIETPPIALHSAPGRTSWHSPVGLAAAAVLLVAATAAVTWNLATRGTAQPVVASADQAPSDGAVNATTASYRVAAAYDGQIAALRKILADHPASLDSATQRVLEANLRVIDDAIGHVRAALDSMPSNTLLSDQLSHAYDMKLNTLRQFVAMRTE